MCLASAGTPVIIIVTIKPESSLLLRDCSRLLYCVLECAVLFRDCSRYGGSAGAGAEQVGGGVEPHCWTLCSRLSHGSDCCLAYHVHDWPWGNRTQGELSSQVLLCASHTPCVRGQQACSKAETASTTKLGLLLGTEASGSMPQSCTPCVRHVRCRVVLQSLSSSGFA